MMNQQHLPRPEDQPVRLGQNHGYRLDGESAFLSAELCVPAQFAGANCALELWACEEPHSGGTLAGDRVAQIRLQLPTPIGPYVHRVEARADAELPPRALERSMVLVFVSGSAPGTSEVHDYANYPRRERFFGPRLEGGVAYALDGDEVVLTADGVTNPRSSDNLTGTLSLELWALAGPYAGGALDGKRLAAAVLPRISGQHRLPPVSRRVTFEEPSEGRWELTLLLREWTLAHGYVTRDYRNFDLPYERLPLREPNAEALPQVKSAAAPGDAPAGTSLRLVPAVDPIANLPAPRAPARATTASSEPVRVSIQNASVEQLARVKGLNGKIAKEIIKCRPFASIDELVKVRGIGEKTLRRIRALVTI